MGNRESYCRWIFTAVLVLALIIPPGRAFASGHPAPAKSGHGDSGHAGASHGGSKPDEPDVKEDATKSGTRGVDLGTFRIRAYHVPESQKSMATFSLYATVAEDKLSGAKRLFDNRKHKLRDQVIVVTRLLPLGDFDDPELKSFRRRILLQLRRSMPELAIDNVYISDFELQVERI